MRFNLLKKPKAEKSEVIYIGRTKSTLSVLAQCKKMEDSPMPAHDPQRVKDALYPPRAA